jgi:CubicO group peptidase (beta-lactamase class C family)
MSRPEPLSLDVLDPRLAPLCEAHLTALRVPGASVAVVAGDRSYHLAWGRKSVAGAEPITLNTGFDIGSGSKSFVSATVASLVADGLVDWDEPVVRHLPELQLHDPWVTQQVSLRDLCGNRLGLPRAGLMESGLDPSFPPEYVFSRLRHTQPVVPFRSRFTYVNAGHTAAAVAAGRITGLGFLGTLEQRILAPLGMRNTSGGSAARTAVPEQAAWHAHVDGQPLAIDTLYTDQFLGAGGMVVSGADALQWLRLHLNGACVDGQQILAREALLETHRPQVVARPGLDILSLFCPDAQMAAYGLGWAVSDLQGHPLVCHSGGIFGATSMTLLLPRTGIGVAVYANSAAPVSTPLGYALAAVLLGLPARDWAGWFDKAALRQAGTQAAAAAPMAQSAKLVPPTKLAPSTEFPPAAPSATDRAAADQHWLASVIAACAGRYEHPADGALLLAAAEGGLRGQVPHGYRMAFIAVPCMPPPESTLPANTPPSADEVVFKVLFEHAERQSAAPGELRFTLEGGRAVRVLFRFGVCAREFMRSGDA